MNVQIKNSAIGLVILAAGLCLFNALGCASLKESTRGFVGISTKVLEDTRKDAKKGTLNYDYAASYKQVKSVLQEKGSYIYTEDAAKKMIAIYVSQLDTTPVGIFFSEVNDNTTQVEVSSPSTFAKELIWARIFAPVKPQEQKGTGDAQGSGNK